MSDHLSPEQVADMHNISPENVYRILRSDQKHADAERQFPGAEKVGDKYRGEWRIPRASAEAWRPRKRGRPSKHP